MGRFLNYKILFLGIVILFITLHILGLGVPYHQDEYKWVYYSHPELNPAGTIPHPPLTEFVYTRFGPLLGDDNFRIIPFAFGLINLFLIFYLAKIISDPFDKLMAGKTALWTALLFTISFYSLLASLMVDVDGAVMPMFLLIMAIGYFRLRKTNFQFSISPNESVGRVFNFAIIIVGAIGGFLVKMSGVLPLVAFAIDFAVIKEFFSDKKRFIKFLGLGVVLAIIVVAVLLLAKLVFPFFPIEKSIIYWKHFANSSSFADRGWLQTFIQFAKAIMYTSPLLILPAFLSSRDVFKIFRPFFIFIFIGLFFYIFAFDFSIGALDRYFQFVVIPLCLVSGAVFSRTLNNLMKDLGKEDFVAILIISAAIFGVQFFVHFVPSLYPKTEWLERIVSLKLNFLFPFTGGSGPTGFYISFLFIFLIWICSLVFSVFYLGVKEVRKKALFCILILGILYNAVFVEEYLFGKINGSPYGLFDSAKKFIIDNADIKSVVVYNDTGGYGIQETKKYARRMYATPQFEDTYRKFLSDFNGHILYIDIPKIEMGSFYEQYLSECSTVFSERDKHITATIFDCRANI